ncbi:MAG: alpha/beta fold hydrolase [Marmoricola sp.]
MMHTPNGGLAGVVRPRVEGTVAVRDGRRLSYAEFGAAGGEAFVWMHGTPGARRQVPFDARVFAEEKGLRIIGIDRPGIGSSTPHLYPNILDWTRDLEIVADTLGMETFRVIGLSGGGPYTLAAGAALPDRVKALGVLGGVAPLVGPDAIKGGIINIAPYAAPILKTVRRPLGFAMSRAIRVIRPLAGAAIGGYAAVQPVGDKTLLREADFRNMFLDDLLNGARYQVSAPMADVVLFARDWGFTARDVTVPVYWWHGDADHIIPHAHGEHLAARLPEAVFTTVPGQAHLGGLGIAAEVLTTLLQSGNPPAGLAQ